ncbi:hypothetical protein TNCV_2091801 [Trichonephila clavipes]|nr:hypothetical protein TNCV_2091801 [Trichonephila clavipes]
MRDTVNLNIDPWHQVSPEVRLRYSSITCVATHNRAHKTHFLLGSAHPHTAGLPLPHLLQFECSWDSLERQVGQPMSLVELEARTEQL